jgi:hypothetical protein
LASVTRRSFSHPSPVDELQGCYFKVMRALYALVNGISSGGKQGRSQPREALISWRTSNQRLADGKSNWPIGSEVETRQTWGPRCELSASAFLHSSRPYLFDSQSKHRKLLKGCDLGNQRSNVDPIGLQTAPSRFLVQDPDFWCKSPFRCKARKRRLCTRNPLFEALFVQVAAFLCRPNSLPQKLLKEVI